MLKYLTSLSLSLLLNVGALLFSSPLHGNQEIVAAPLTPTERYLKENSLDEIRHYFDSHSSYRFTKTPFDTHLPLFIELIEAEKEKGFFGYHGCSQEYRLFQDVLRALFSEVLQIEVPPDFQFLRIPGEELFDLQENVASFYQLFDPKIPSLEMQLQMIDGLLLKPFTEYLEAKQIPYHLSLEQKKGLQPLLWPYVENFAKQLFDYSIGDAPDASIIDLIPHWVNGPASVTFEEKLEERGDIVAKGIDNRYKQKFLKKLQLIAKSKGMAPTVKAPQIFPPAQGGLVLNPGSVAPPHLQEVAEALEQMLDHASLSQQEIASWFFLHVNFYNLNHLLYSLTDDNRFDTPILHYFEPYNDVRPEQQSRVVCLNIPLFGNYHMPSESSIAIFAKNRSVEDGEWHIQTYLQQFFTKIGLSADLVKPMLQCGRQMIAEAQVKTGCILQFFEREEETNLVDQICFTGFWMGVPLKEVPPSSLIAGIYPLKKSIADLQLRLLTSNHLTLNPQRGLRILRYDQLPEGMGDEIIAAMKGVLSQAVIDRGKLESYQNQLKGYGFYP